MYNVLSTKIPQGSHTASGTVLRKRCSRCTRICGLNPRLIYLQRVFKNLFLKLNFFKDSFCKDFDHNYCNNSLKYVTNRTLFPQQLPS